MRASEEVVFLVIRMYMSPRTCMLIVSKLNRLQTLLLHHNSRVKIHPTRFTLKIKAGHIFQPYNPMLVRSKIIKPEVKHKAKKAGFFSALGHSDS